MKTGLVRAGYDPITFEDGKATFGKPVYFADAEAGAREYSAESRGEPKKIWANSQLVYAGEKNSGYDISLTLIDIIDDIKTAWFRDTKIENGGVLELAKTMERPHFALILSEETTDGKGKTTIYYNCVAGKRPSIAGKTAEEGEWEDQFPEYSIISTPLPENNFVKYEISGTAKLTEITLPTLSQE